MFSLPLILTVGLLQGQAAPLLKTDFESDAGGWTSVSAEGRLAVTHDAGLIKSGTGALRFDYQVAKGKMCAMVLPVSEGALAKMKSLRFCVKPDHDTTIVAALQEKGGGRYMAMASAKKDAWQIIELSPSDFSLNDGPGDPADPNGKLDVDQVEAVMLSDFSQFFAQADENIARLFNLTPGERFLCVDDFQATDAALPDSAGKVAEGYRIEGFTRPHLAWIAAGKTKIEKTSGNAMKIDYSVSAGTLAGVIRSIMPGALAGMDRVTLSIASNKACRLMVQLEEKGGGKYSAILEMPARANPKETQILFSAFTPAQDSNDANGKLDAGEIKQILILDVSGMIDQADLSNTLTLGAITAKTGS